MLRIRFQHEINHLVLVWVVVVGDFEHLYRRGLYCLYCLYCLGAGDVSDAG